MRYTRDTFTGVAAEGPVHIEYIKVCALLDGEGLKTDVYGIFQVSVMYQCSIRSLPMPCSSLIIGRVYSCIIRVSVVYHTCITRVSQCAMLYVLKYHTVYLHGVSVMYSWCIMWDRYTLAKTSIILRIHNVSEHDTTIHYAFKYPNICCTCISHVSHVYQWCIHGFLLV